MKLAEIWGWPQDTGWSRPVPDVDNHPWSEFLGIELELEAVDPFPDGSLQDWELHNDASLRNGVEFVTRQGLYGESLALAIKSFYRQGYDWTAGPRTSTHIHVNLKDSTDDDLRSMVMLMYFLEHPLYSCVEESRKWAGYSMPLSEMPASRVRDMLNPQTQTAFIRACSPSRNSERYYGLNLCLSRHGTAEFRYFPGGPSEEELTSWVDFVVAIKKAAKKYTIHQLMERIQRPGDIESLIFDILPESWASRLMGTMPVESIYDRFVEVAALASDDSNPERSGSLVHITPSFLKYIEKVVLKGHQDACNMLREVTKGISIMSSDDWGYYMRIITQKSDYAVLREADAAQTTSQPEDSFSLETLDDEEDDTWNDALLPPVIQCYGPQTSSTEEQVDPSPHDRPRSASFNHIPQLAITDITDNINGPLTYGNSSASLSERQRAVERVIYSLYNRR